MKKLTIYNEEETVTDNKTVLKEEIQKFRELLLAECRVTRAFFTANDLHTIFDAFIKYKDLEHIDESKPIDSTLNIKDSQQQC